MWVLILQVLPIQYLSEDERKLRRYPVSVADFGSARVPPACLQNCSMRLNINIIANSYNTLSKKFNIEDNQTAITFYQIGCMIILGWWSNLIARWICGRCHPGENAFCITKVHTMTSNHDNQRYKFQHIDSFVLNSVD